MFFFSKNTISRMRRRKAFAFLEEVEGVEKVEGARLNHLNHFNDLNFGSGSARLGIAIHIRLAAVNRNDLPAHVGIFFAQKKRHHFGHLMGQAEAPG
jgi:hypothetical protein